MNVLKIGTLHKENGVNCQDATGQYLNILKVVCDGCSEGKHTEVGAKLFCKNLIEKFTSFIRKGKTNIDISALITSTMDELVRIIGHNPEDIKDYLCFTILVAEFYPGSNAGYVYYCGDGYIIKDVDETICIDKLDCGEYPKYLAYNYIDSDYLKEYKTGVNIEFVEFEDIGNIGVASDGIRFVAELDYDDPLRKEFVDILASGKEMKMKLFFNRNAKILHDDFSIVF